MKTKTQQYTPTPKDYELGSALISAGFGVPYAEAVKRAVNSHEALLEAAKKARLYISREPNLEIQNAFIQLDRAIKQAEGGK